MELNLVLTINLTASLVIGWQCGSIEVIVMTKELKQKAAE
jgi:hypothetical protein